MQRVPQLDTAVFGAVLVQLSGHLHHACLVGNVLYILVKLKLNETVPMEELS